MNAGGPSRSPGIQETLEALGTLETQEDLEGIESQKVLGTLGAIHNIGLGGWDRVAIDF